MKEVRYLASPGGPWLHYLHGNVPGHQLDWICRPRGMPNGVTPQHVQHLLDLIQVHDVPSPGDVTLTFANLSLKDTTWRPGRGGLGIIAHFRIPASLDHGGRKNPRFVHALLSVGQPLDAASIDAAVKALFTATLDDRAAPDRPVDWWYARYLAAAEHGEATALEVLESYFASFSRLTVPLIPQDGQRWALEEGERPPREIRVRCGPRTNETWRDAVEAMVGLTSVLYWSRVPWAAVTTGAGRGGDDGIVFRFLFGPPSVDDLEIPLSNLPRDPEALALDLLPLILEEEPHFISALAMADPVTGAGHGARGSEDAGVETVPTPPSFDAPVDVMGWLPPPEGEPALVETSNSGFQDDDDDDILEGDGPVVPMDMDALVPSESDMEDDEVRPLPPPLGAPSLAAVPSVTMPPLFGDGVTEEVLVEYNTADIEVDEEPPARPPAPPAPPPAPPEPVAATTTLVPENTRAIPAVPPPDPAPPLLPLTHPSALGVASQLPDAPTQVPRPPAPPVEPGPNPKLILGIGALLGLGGVALLAWLFWPRPQVHPVDTRPRTSPVVQAPSAPVEAPAAPVEAPAAPVEAPAAPTEAPSQAASAPKSSTKPSSKASKTSKTAPAAPTTPAQPSAPKGSVELDAKGVEVRANGKVLKAGANALPPGTYKLTAHFSDMPDAMSFGSFQLAADGVVHVRCDGGLYTCSAR